MRSICIPTLGIAVGMAMAVPGQAQDVQYTTTGKVELSGALGTVARLFGGGDETVDTTYVKGAMMRTDSDGTSSIFDLENGRMISIDHKAKTYTIMTFAQMTEAVEGAMEQAKAEAAQQTGNEAAAEPEGEVDLQYDLSIDPTGEKQKINGYEAERYFMTMETEITMTPEGGEAQEAGRIVMLVDMWNARDVPVTQAMETFYERAPEMAAQSRESMQGMAAVFAANPQLEGAMEEAAKESEQLEGFTLRSTTYVVMVAPDAEFDRELALQGKAESNSSSGQTARRALGGLLGGLGGKKEEAKKEEAATQSVFMKIHAETKDMKTTSLSTDLFQPPAGYTEKPFAMPTAR